VHSRGINMIDLSHVSCLRVAEILKGELGRDFDWELTQAYMERLYCLIFYAESQAFRDSEASLSA